MTEQLTSTRSEHVKNGSPWAGCHNLLVSSEACAQRVADAGVDGSGTQRAPPAGNGLGAEPAVNQVLIGGGPRGHIPQRALLRVLCARDTYA
jgi:hypothetical protein